MSAQSHRFREPVGGSAMLAWPWLVVCPRCNGMATVERGLRCPSCGLVRDGNCALITNGTVRQALATDGAWRRDREPRQRWPQPTYVSYPLWLRRECCGGNVLWATNAQHLGYLRDYIGADLREGSHVPHQRLHHKLPTWMKRASNRDELLHVITDLERQL